MKKTEESEAKKITDFETGRLLTVENRKDILIAFQDLLDGKGIANFDAQDLRDIEYNAFQKGRKIHVGGIHLQDLRRFKEVANKILWAQKGRKAIMLLSGNGTLQKYYDLLQEYKKISEITESDVYYGFIDCDMKDYLFSYVVY